MHNARDSLAESPHPGFPALSRTGERNGYTSRFQRLGEFLKERQAPCCGEEGNTGILHTLLLMKIIFFSLLLSLAAPAALIAQETPDRPAADSPPLSSEPSAKEHDDKKHHAADRERPVLSAVLLPTKGNEARGVVTFEPVDDDEVRISVRLSGLKPNAKHAMHIHEFGDVSSEDGSSAGGHFNPTGKAHGLPGDEERHVGDFGNLETDADGNANHVLTVRDLALVEGDHAIIGRAVIVHAGEDKGTQPSGDAGPRIAQGVIAIANPASMKSGVASTGESASDPATTRATTRATTSNASAAPPTAGERLERAAEKVGEGAEKAARTTVRAVERGAEEVGEVLKKVGETVEDAVE